MKRFVDKGQRQEQTRGHLILSNPPPTPKLPQEKKKKTNVPTIPVVFAFGFFMIWVTDSRISLRNCMATRLRVCTNVMQKWRLREKKDKVRWIWEKEEKHSEIKQLQMQEFIGCLFMTYIVKLLPVLGIRALKYPDCKLAWGCHALGVIKTHRGKSNTPGCSVPPLPSNCPLL